MNEQEKLFKQIEKFADENYLNVSFGTFGNDEPCAEFEYGSDLGEDVIFVVGTGKNFKEFAENLKEYTDDYDEKIKAQMGVNYSFGRFGDVTVEEISDTADRIGTSIEKLWRNMHDECGNVVNGDYLDKLVEIANQMPGVSLEFEVGDEGFFELTFEKGEPGSLVSYHEFDVGTDKDDIAAHVFDEINYLYGNFDYNDHTREFFEVSIRDAINGFPSDIGAVVEDNKKQQAFISELGNKAEDFSTELELEEKEFTYEELLGQLNQKLDEAKTLTERIAAAKELKEFKDSNRENVSSLEKQDRKIEPQQKNDDER